MINVQLKDYSITFLNKNVTRIKKCLDLLDKEEIWADHNENLVSIGNLLLHLQGNVTQYVISTLGRKEFNRQRDKEFSAKKDMSGDELHSMISETVKDACDTIRGLTDEDLTEQYKVQVYEYTGVGILIHVVEHFSYHVGQIVFAVKSIKNRDLG